jgi:deoxyribodipyrimidine photo-lyase
VPRLSVPQNRIRDVNDAPVRSDRSYVLHWMTAFRRVEDNHALDRAFEWCRELDKPLLVLEALRVAYPHASARLHRFVLDGMAENRARFAEAGIAYLPYVERAEGEGKGLLAALAEDAAVVTTDDYPTFFHPRMIAAAGRQLDVRLEAVDAHGLLPMRLAPREFPTARGFRTFSQQELPRALRQRPVARLEDQPTVGRATVSEAVAARWSFATADALADTDALVASLPVDPSVSPTEERGGAEAGLARWQRFLEHGFGDYADGRNQPDEDGSSGMSPYLHFGFVGPHRLFDDVAEKAGWTLGDQAPKATGKRDDFWNMGPAAEALLEQLTVWRELSINGAHRRDDLQSLSALPNWAQKTLAEHADDPRPELYSLEELEGAETSDEIWNAAQRQLVGEGRIHNYLRMLWGKKILQWSPTPEAALERMLLLNDRYALDGRDPNSYAGITWVLGRYDRAWGPERPIFGKVRYMTSDSTRRKLRLKKYLARWS